MSKNAIVVIPARYHSSRFEGKPLALINNKTMIQHVYEGVSTANSVAEIIVATDNRRIFDTVKNFGGNAVMTGSSHPSGTDRIAEAIKSYHCELVVNVQGDEPLIKGEMVDNLIELMDDKRADMGTLVKKIENEEEIKNSNVVKVVFTLEKFALYFSRNPIPYTNSNENRVFYKHIGIYCYRKNVLMSLTQKAQSMLESAEKLEQLRALENGFQIKVMETYNETIGVDTKEDLIKTEKWLNTYL